MKKVLILLLVFTLLLVGCGEKKQEENEVVPQTTENTVNTATEQTTTNKNSDEELLAKLKEEIRVVENRQDFNDLSGELLYYVQKDYLETDSEDKAIKKIVANFPKEDLKDPQDDYLDEIHRMYPEEVYYDTTTYEIAGVHNGILTININSDYWFGSPHPYPHFACKNYSLSTGEEYEFPADVSDEIYEEATNAWMNMAASMNYDGLMGDYYREDNLNIQYLSYDEETETYYLSNEEALNEIVNKELKKGCFAITDEVIKFYIDAENNLCPWATRALYSYVEIENRWGI